MNNFYTHQTHDITVSVEPIFLPNESAPDRNEFIWAYHVEIENNRLEPIHLRARHWLITDSLGRTIEVKGQGVVGEEPLINPGEVYSYTSGTPLSTPSGIMAGAYEIELPNGKTLEVKIPTFSLDSPHDFHMVN